MDKETRERFEKVEEESASHGKEITDLKLWKATLNGGYAVAKFLWGFLCLAAYIICALITGHWAKVREHLAGLLPW